MSGSSLELNGTVLSYNNAHYAGGAIYNVGSTNLALKNRARIFGNQANDGGGVWTDSYLGVNGALIINNTARVGKGGGILVSPQGSLGGVISYVKDNNPENIVYLNKTYPKTGAPKTGNNIAAPLQKEAMRNLVEEIRGMIGTMNDQIEVIEGQVA
jgi:hypothetical protein